MFNKFYSNIASSAQASDVRKLLEYAVLDDFISFGGGLPSEDAFPMQDIEIATQKAFQTYKYRCLQYGPTEGVPELLSAVQTIMEARNVKSDLGNLLITTGSQQALDLCGKAFINKGDYIICESPTYLAAINAFKAYEPNFLDAPMDNEGIIPDVIEDYAKKYPVKFIYLIPDFQNPTGKSLSVARRKQIIDIANRYDLLIIEDSPYSELCYDHEPYAPLKSYDSEERIIYLSTFSKIVCPGLRLGWMVAHPDLISKIAILKQAVDLHTNQMAQYIVASYLTHFDITAQIDKIRELYRKKRDAMVNAVEKYFPSSVTYNIPTGGMFVWAEIPENFKSREIAEKALTYRIGFVPGDAFYPNGGVYNGLRMNFSNATFEEIESGIERLGMLLKETLN